MTNVCAHNFIGGECIECGTSQADFEASFADARVPDFTEEATGFRAWKVVGPSRSPRLMSVTYGNFIWPTNRWTFAKCAAHCGDIPGERCTCGIYAARTRAHLIGELGYAAYGENDVKVIGLVGLAGKVIPGTQGWRAEKARVKKLYVPAEHWKLAVPLAKQYRCKIAVDNTWEIDPQVRSARGGDDE